jgi:hypothetical protein
MQAPITVPIEALFKFTSKLLVIEGDQKGTNLNKTKYTLPVVICLIRCSIPFYII